MTLSRPEIAAKVAEAVITASTTFRPDQKEAYQRAVLCEEKPEARWVLETILENARVAEEKRLPLCDDTGIPHLFLEVGDEAVLPPGFFAAVQEGVREGLRRLPGRPMAVLGEGLQRIDQSGGLSGDSGDVLPAPVQIQNIPGKKVRLTVLLLGGGPEIRGKTQRVFHHHSGEVVLAEMVRWAKEGVARLGCLPGVLAFGIGRTNLEAAVLAVEALKDGDFTVQSALEQQITRAVNESGIGPLGLGGSATVLATFLKIGPQRASGVRIVSLRAGCCFDPRRASVVF